ncbi:hypothetical protein FACS1894151_09070 [Spirochaetia bacterium]|nr:hypothetical protein FACS1894151_09070 [Spirochaetia bacterium]
MGDRSDIELYAVILRPFVNTKKQIFLLVIYMVLDKNTSLSNDNLTAILTSLRGIKPQRRGRRR